MSDYSGAIEAAQTATTRAQARDATIRIGRVIDDPTLLADMGGDRELCETVRCSLYSVIARLRTVGA